MSKYKDLEDEWIEGYWKFICDNEDKIDLGNISNNPNITWNIIKNNLNKNWDWHWISKNPNITWEIIQNNLDKNWDFSVLSSNPIITTDIIEQYPDKAWNWNNISKNPNLTWEFIQKNPDKKWNWRSISKHKNITWEIIQNNPDKEWDKGNISNNPNITRQIIEDNMGKDFMMDDDDEDDPLSMDCPVCKDWCWCELSYHPKITWDFVLKNFKSYESWKLEDIFKNQKFVWETIQRLQADKLNKYEYSFAAKIGLQGEIRYYMKSGDIEAVKRTEQQSDTETIGWFWVEMSKNNNLTWELVQNNPDKDWDWEYISTNPNITWDIIQNNPEENWDRYWIPRNPNITWEHVQNNPNEDWGWEYKGRQICFNTMAKGKEKWIATKRLHIIKALQIQRHWRNYSCNPEYPLATL